MTTVAQRNIKIFEYFFASGRESFADWLSEYLHDGRLHPFVMHGREEYDLGDLLDTIVSNFPAQIDDLKQALIGVLQPIGHSLDTDKFNIIVHAIARSAFTPVASEAARVVEQILETVDRSSTLDRNRISEIVLCLDTAIPSIAGLSLRTDDATLLRLCKKLFADDELALFAGSLFAPVAIHDIKNWPLHWARVIEMATAEMSVLNLNPADSEIVTILPGGKERSAHYKVDMALQGFVRRATEAGISIEEIVDALQNCASDELKNVVQFAFDLLHNCENPIIGMKNDVDDGGRLILFYDSGWFFRRGIKLDVRLAVVEIEESNIAKFQGFFETGSSSYRGEEVRKSHLISAARSRDDPAMLGL